MKISLKKTLFGCTACLLWWGYAFLRPVELPLVHGNTVLRTGKDFYNAAYLPPLLKGVREFNTSVSEPGTSSKVIELIYGFHGSPKLAHQWEKAMLQKQGIRMKLRREVSSFTGDRPTRVYSLQTDLPVKKTVVAVGESVGSISTTFYLNE